MTRTMFRGKARKVFHKAAAVPIRKRRSLAHEHGNTPAIAPLSGTKPNMSCSGDCAAAFFRQTRLPEARMRLLADRAGKPPLSAPTHLTRRRDDMARRARPFAVVRRTTHHATEGGATTGRIRLVTRVVAAVGSAARRVRPVEQSSSREKIDWWQHGHNGTEARQ